MTASLVGFFIFWGIWLFIPLLVDGITAVSYLAGGIWMNRTRHRSRRSHVLSEYPKVSLIVPVYNGREVIARCIQSLLAQRYPADKLEIVVVDNLSNDGTLEIV